MTDSVDRTFQQF